jgi:Tfp pilus assembly PilM family ATPase
MKLNQAHFLSISITPSAVKVALVKSSGFVDKLVTRPIDKGGPDTALRSAIEGMPVKGAGVLCVIPGDVATTKNIEVPSITDEEIDSILALQASRHTPFNKDEILTAHIKIGNPKPNFTRVLLIVVKRETVKEKIAVLKRAGLDVSAVQFVPEGIARFYAAAFKVKKTDLPIAIIDVGMQSTNFIVESQSAIVMSRNIPIGIGHLSSDTEASQQLVNEIKASLETYDQESIDRKPFRYVMTTNHSALLGLDAKIGDVLGVKVEMAPYASFLQASKAVKEVIARDFSDETALDVIAPGMAAAKCQADLVPQEIKDQRAIAEKGRETFKAGVLIVLFLFFLGGALMSKVYFKDAFLKRNLVEKYADQRQEVKNLEKLIAKTKILREYMVARDLPLEAVRELYRIIPPEIYLGNIGMDDAGGERLHVCDRLRGVAFF